MPFLRIIDVNLNRLDESLKFIEDIVRLYFADRVLLSQTRLIRNAFRDFKKSLPLKEIIRSRRSTEDPGRPAKFDERTKKPISAVILSNMSRAKEASRTLEELGKAFGVESSGLIKEIRFKIYDLEKDIVRHLDKIFNPYLHVIIDEQYLSAYNIENLTDTLTANGATMIQLRVKTMDDRSFLKYAIRIRKKIGTREVRFIVNNRLDIAIACNAHGVHLGQTDIPARVARRGMGDSAIIGISARTVKEAKKAQSDGADYLGVGALYPTRTKPDASRCALTTFRAICRSVRIPVIGIGGVDDRNYKAILRAGASGIAVSSFAFGGNMKKRLRSLTPK